MWKFDVNKRKCLVARQCFFFFGNCSVHDCTLLSCLITVISIISRQLKQVDFFVLSSSKKIWGLQMNYWLCTVLKSIRTKYWYHQCCCQEVFLSILVKFLASLVNRVSNDIWCVGVWVCLPTSKRLTYIVRVPDVAQVTNSGSRKVPKGGLSHMSRASGAHKPLLA